MSRMVLAAMAGALALAGCGAQTGGQADKPEADRVGTMPDGVILAGAAQNGTTLDMRVGQVLRVELESIPTAGYVWNVTERPEFLEFAGEGQRPTDPANQNQPGFTGGNHWLWTDFKAVAEGTGTLVLKEGRPWETDEPATDTFTLSVTVLPAQ